MLVKIETDDADAFNAKALLVIMMKWPPVKLKPSGKIDTFWSYKLMKPKTLVSHVHEIVPEESCDDPQESRARLLAISGVGYGEEI